MPASCSTSTYGEDDRIDTALRINADHARATAFLIHDGVLPSNEGRGYVLRKIMRRAMRNGRMIGVEEPFLYKLTGFVADFMKPAYPEMLESMERVARVVKDEEHRYATTFQVAERLFHDEAKSAQGGVLAAPRRSSCTTRSAWRSTSRKRWRASSACTSIARVRHRDGAAARARARQLERRR